MTALCIKNKPKDIYYAIVGIDILMFAVVTMLFL